VPVSAQAHSNAAGLGGLEQVELGWVDLEQAELGWVYVNRWN